MADLKSELEGADFESLFPSVISKSKSGNSRILAPVREKAESSTSLKRKLEAFMAEPKSKKNRISMKTVDSDDELFFKGIE